ncbi:hypothetical protein [Verminephrobacter eiseniae]|uniref:hypothetical protein n=1 Tax=Verminephrobacter eiseniae TaxID=364317 RepID=UPI0022379A53
MASLYAEAIARGHVFNDANKRTALTCAIAYIEQQGRHVRQDPVLEEATRSCWPRADRPGMIAPRS